MHLSATICKTNQKNGGIGGGGGGGGGGGEATSPMLKSGSLVSKNEEPFCSFFFPYLIACDDLLLSKRK